MNTKYFCKIEDIVEHIMMSIEKTRDNDDLLYFYVCNEINPNCAGVSFSYFIKNREELGLPPFETVRRTRQNIQSRGKLLGSNITRLRRRENAREYLKSLGYKVDG